LEFVTASQDGAVLVWDVASGAKLPPFRGHRGPVYAAVADQFPGYPDDRETHGIG